MRDLKAKDVELDSVKRQVAWMKEALGKAAKAGFAFNVEGEGGGGLGGVGALEEGVDEKQAELALKFKQFRAHVQVCFVVNFMSYVAFENWIFCRTRWDTRPSKRLKKCLRQNGPKRVQCKKLLITVPS